MSDINEHHLVPKNLDKNPTILKFQSLFGFNIFEEYRVKKIHI